MSERFEDLPSEEAKHLFDVIQNLIWLLSEQEAVANGNPPMFTADKRKSIYREAQIARNDLARQI